MQNNTIVAKMPNELSVIFSNDIASMYPNTIINEKAWTNAKRHKFQYELDATSAYYFWQESRSRKDMLRYLAKKWVIKRHKQLFPEEYV